MLKKLLILLLLSGAFWWFWGKTLEPVREKFYETDFKFGVNIGMAIGATGAATAAHGITADTLSYARSKGVFLGIALAGARVTVSDESNAAYYGRPVGPTDILVKGDVKNEKSVSLRELVAKLMK